VTNVKTVEGNCENRFGSVRFGSNDFRTIHFDVLRITFQNCIALYNVFTPTRNALDFKHASQLQGTHKYMKEYKHVYVAIGESVRFMALIHLL